MDLVHEHKLLNIMKVLQTISGLGARSGGPSTCTLDLMNGLCGLGGDCAVDLLTVSSPDILGKESKWLKEVPNDCRPPFMVSRNVQQFLYTTDYELYHCNALWMGVNHDTCRIAREKHKPYIISPHGMLYPTALKVHAWKKWILLNLWYNKDIRQAACLHATCSQEAKYCRLFGYKGPIAVIPNAVVFPEDVKLKDETLNMRDAKGRRQIGFLGRLHSIKKVENLLYAIDLLPREKKEKVSLQIMGKYDDVYEKWLKDEVKRLGLEDCVDFVGFVTGKDKYDRLAKLSALFVPSAQENFGMIVPEALICGTPVYASLGTPWSELNECNAGWWKGNDPSTIAMVIQEILSLTETQLIEKGRNGRKLMEEKYEQHKVARMVQHLYSWILYGGEKPEFVYE